MLLLLLIPVSAACDGSVGPEPSPTLSAIMTSYANEGDDQQLIAGDKRIGFIFAQSSPLARGAMRAIEETGSGAKLVAFSGDMDMISAIEAGSMDAAIFIGPRELADVVVDNAGQYIDNPSFVLDSFIQMNIEVVTADNTSDYLSEELAHAQIIAN